MDESQIVAVVGAIGELNPNDDAHFTKGGKPSANALTELVGFDVSSQLRDAAWERYQNQSDAPQGADPAESTDDEAEASGVEDGGDDESSEEAEDPDTGEVVHKKDFIHGNIIKDGNRKIGDWFRHVPTGKKYYAPKSLAKERGLPAYPFGA